MKSQNNNNSSEPIYTLAAASKLSSVPSHSIRQYIDKGLNCAILIIETPKKSIMKLAQELAIEKIYTIFKMIPKEYSKKYALLPSIELRVEIHKDFFAVIVDEVTAELPGHEHPTLIASEICSRISDDINPEPPLSQEDCDRIMLGKAIFK